MMIYVNTRSSKKKRKPNAKQRELEASWNEIVKKYEPKKSIKPSVRKVPISPETTIRRETAKYPSLVSNHYDCYKKDTPVYTGTKVKGIGTMHKSNAVPIFNDEEAKDIAKMRR